MLSLIVAIDENNAIGNSGDMLCYLPNDLKHFKTLTSGHTVMMGRKTWLSLPKRPLPNRRNLIISTQTPVDTEGGEWVHSIDEALQAVAQEEEVFVIGGGTIYEQLMPFAQKLYITHIHHAFEEADTFFPKINTSLWRLVSEEQHAADERHAYDYTFAEYVRR